MHKKKRGMSTVGTFPLSKTILLRPCKYKSTRKGNRGGLQDKKIMKIRTISTFLHEREEETQRVEDHFIHEDIFLEILVRLPLKSLHMCKSLSKKYYHLISSVSFGRSYLNFRRRSVSSMMLGFLYQSEEPFMFNRMPIRFISDSPERKKSGISVLPWDHDRRQHSVVRMVASSNGFVLSRKEMMYALEWTREEYYNVCNPFTKQRVVLPKPPQAKFDCLVEAFICDGNNYPCLDWTAFKVIRGLETKHPTSSTYYLDVQIFSSQTGEWIEFQLSTFSYPSTVYLSGDSVISERETVCLNATDEAGRVVFVVFNVNFNTEHLRIVTRPRPESFEYKGVGACLGQSQGFIQYMIYNWRDNFEIWELNEDSSSETKWFLRYTVSTPQIFPGRSCDNFGFLAFHPLNSAVVLLYHGEKIVLVDLKTKGRKVISDYCSIMHCRCCWLPCQWPCGPHPIA